MPISILTPEAMKQQQILERQLARERRGEVENKEEEAVKWLIAKLVEQGDMDEEDGKKTLDEGNYRTQTFRDWADDFKHGYGYNLTDTLWQYFSFDDLVLDLWRNDGYYILYDHEGTWIALEDIGDHFPLWQSKEVSWFKDHPCKDRFYVIHLG